MTPCGGVASASKSEAIAHADCVGGTPTRAGWPAKVNLPLEAPSRRRGSVFISVFRKGFAFYRPTLLDPTVGEEQTIRRPIRRTLPWMTEALVTARRIRCSGAKLRHVTPTPIPPAIHVSTW